MRSAPIVVRDEFADCGSKIPFIERNDEIQTFSADGADHALKESVRSGRSDRSPECSNTEIFQHRID